MRAALLIAAIACAGCGAPRVPPPAAPAAPEAQKAPAGLVAIDPPRVCVVRNGALDVVEVQYNPRTSDSTYQGVPFAEAFPITVGYALRTDWYRDSDSITVAGRTYAEYGIPRVLGPQELQRAGEYRGVPVFVGSDQRSGRDMVYVPLRPGCEFQPYMDVDSMSARRQ
jgi:hypothetical protein